MRGAKAPPVSSRSSTAGPRRVRRDAASLGCRAGAMARRVGPETVRVVAESVFSKDDPVRVEANAAAAIAGDAEYRCRQVVQARARLCSLPRGQRAMHAHLLHFGAPVVVNSSARVACSPLTLPPLLRAGGAQVHAARQAQPPDAARHQLRAAAARLRGAPAPAPVIAARRRCGRRSHCACARQPRERVHATITQPCFPWGPASACAAALRLPAPAASSVSQGAFPPKRRPRPRPPSPHAASTHLKMSPLCASTGARPVGAVLPGGRGGVAR